MDNECQPDDQATNSSLTFLDKEPLSWLSPRADQDSAWHGHISFAHWVVQALRPTTIVELGTHNGVSYAAFCNAVQKCGLATKCYAIDTWMGDAHAGTYGETVYSKIKAFNEQHFAGFSTLLRCTFDDALSDFRDGSVDLLHIDGLHTYEAVAHDFRSWLPKLSNCAVVLFHDTAVRERDFAVWKLWEELTQRYPHFTFHHAAGLGVLGVGHHLPDALTGLWRVGSSPEAAVVRNRFEQASKLAYENAIDEKNRLRAQLLTSLEFKGKNIALGCHAAQSSGFLGSEMTPGGAVTGVRTGLFGFHTECEMNPWWMIDLGGRRTMSEIVVFNRLDGECAGRARNLIVKTSFDCEEWSELYRCNGLMFGGLDGAPLQIRCGGTSARFIRLQLDGFNYLHLDQVEIYERTT